MQQRIYLLSILLIMSNFVFTQSSDIIPKPQNYQTNGEVFQITSDVIIIYSDALKPMAEYLANALSPAIGWDFTINKSKAIQGKTISLTIDDSDKIEKEGYQLFVKNNSIQIVASTPAGIFNGIQTLLQMLPIEIYSKQRQKGIDWVINGVQITDAPLYPWRGMMLDASRYFFDKDYVLHLLDMMAIYKMNVLHLHLIDDAGWRLEIKKYPKLTSVGAWRGEGHERVGGYYTQEDIKEIVAYASLRNIDVFPEIELPAHTLSAIAAYPWLSCTEEQHVVPSQHFISPDLYCVGKETTFEFLENVLKETFELFPSKYLHIGGDEANYKRWRKCKHCQARKKELGLKTEKDLQVYFTKRIQKIAAKYGKTIVGWDEIIERGLDDKAVGMVWHDQSKAILGAQAGHDLVMALTEHCYFDAPESSIAGEVKAATWIKPISLQKVYELNPMIKGLNEKYHSQVLGAHATLWSDQFIHGTILQEIAPINENRSEKYFDYLTFPRMAALAEVCWTPTHLQDWDDFENRMKTHYNRFDKADYGYRVPQPKLISKHKANDGFEIILENLVNGAEIRYTTDGTPANVHSQTYTSPIIIEELNLFQAITVVNHRQYSLPLYFPYKYDKLKNHGAIVAEWNSSQIQANKFDLFEIDAAEKINQNGTYKLSFWYIEGRDRLDIEKIEVFKNGHKIAEDKHSAFAGKKNKRNIYSFNIDGYETGAAFSIKATVRGHSGNDSKGAVFIKLKK
ncbi:MAG: family 20 glycosylhydrolase [Bacteroidales bacterium]|nr:family 20 glycosylhydrolase [Bacteroidales bacterium]